MSVRLVATDIDGTLLDSRWQLPEANREAVEAVVALGVEVALVTGRRFDFARPVAELFACPLTLIVNNGAVVKSREGETLLRHLLPAAVAADVLAATVRFRNGAAVVFDRPRENQVIFERIDWANARQRSYAEKNRPHVAEVDPLDGCLTEDPIQIMFSGNVETMRELAAVLRGLPVADRIALALTEYEARDFAMVDVIRAGCSKGAALAEWTSRRGLVASEVLAIGDNLNDVEMLAFAGHRVVMGNAVPGLLARGWPLTGSNDEGGLALALHRYVLEPSSSSHRAREAARFARWRRNA